MITSVFTIVSRNYFHFARTLMNSLASAHPEWDRYVLLVDEHDGTFNSARENCTIIDVCSLPLPNFKQFLFRYNILELNTAVKPWMCEWLFERGSQRVIYMDPDIYVYRRLNAVEDLLDQGASIVLTPHLTGFLDDDLRPTELDIMRSGVYNLGFIALNRHPQVDAFLPWWQKKLEFQAIVDPDAGLFTDQKWIDLVPGMFEDVRILRHPGYNVAYWNLKHRRVQLRKGDYWVNGEPLVFFHFSGINPMQPEDFSKHQNRYRLSEIGDARKLVEQYCNTVKQNGLEECSAYRYAFNQFDDGTPLNDLIRICYRENPHLQELAGENPFANKAIYNLPANGISGGNPIITELMKTVWNRRKDLRLCFPDIQEKDRWGYANWFAQGAGIDHRFDDSFILPVREDLSKLAVSSGKPEMNIVLKQKDEYRIGEFLQYDDKEFIVNAYRGILRRPADPSGLDHYLSALRKGLSKIEILARLRFSKEGRKIGVGISGLFWFFLLGRLGKWLPSIHRNFFRDFEDRSGYQRIQTGNHKDDRREARGVSYGGFYHPGNMKAGLAWMSQEGWVRVGRVQKGDRLRLIGNYDGAPHRKACGKDLVLDIRINDVTVGSIAFEDSGEFDRTLLIEQECEEGVLRLCANQVFVPAELEINEDRRKLSVRIGRIEVNDYCILNFSDSQSPYRHKARAVEGINITGYVTSEHGVGQSARIAAACCDAARIPFAMVDFTVGNVCRKSDESYKHHIVEDNPFPVNLLHINADQMQVAWETLGQDFFEGKYNIGYWAWELPEFPDKWAYAFQYVQEIWVPSTFIQHAIALKAPIPVITMPHAIDISMELDLTRRDLGLPENKFLFLTMFDFLSVRARKNPRAALQAFDKAFGSMDDVCLVIKSQNGDRCPEEYEELKSWVQGHDNMVLMDQTLSRKEIYCLENLCDCFLSLHRAEGFGLGLAESMYLGKVVIATGWSGNMDFMNAENSIPVKYELIEIQEDIGPYNKGHQWAEADVDHAAWQMRRIVEDSSLYREIAAKGQWTIRSFFSPDAIGKRYVQRLNHIHR